MSAPALYATSVPVLQRYLARLTALVDRAGGADLLAARLAPDMLPFATQAEIAANFALRAAYPLAGLPVPDYGAFAATADGLRQRIARVQTLLAQLDPSRFDAARTVSDQAGKALVTLQADRFLHEYALPNFFFHLTTAYAILRAAGLALGKQDYDGWHDYR
ncbi:MAG TPA: DUF1993 domain-containing protein [Burkholderiaceae bacterium]